MLNVRRKIASCERGPQRLRLCDNEKPKFEIEFVCEAIMPDCRKHYKSKLFFSTEAMRRFSAVFRAKSEASKSTVSVQYVYMSALASAFREAFPKTWRARVQDQEKSLAETRSPQGHWQKMEKLRKHNATNLQKPAEIHIHAIENRPRSPLHLCHV